MGIGGFVTRDRRLRSMLEVLPALAQSGCTLLITGETGTGKEHLARLVHALSPRRDGPFIKVGCAGLPPDLLAGQLFGYAAGAINPGEPARPGALRRARLGSLLLDEVGELPAGLQEDLWLLLERQTYLPRGGVRSLPLQARLLAASKCPLEEAVHDQGFREDLCYHLKLVCFHLPPLRERRGDLSLLIERFLGGLSPARKGRALALSDEALEVLLAYHYPGNLRELRNILEQAVMVCRERVIGPGHLPSFLGGQTRPEAAPPPAMAPGRDERQAILWALERHGWRRRAAAQALGMDRTTLWRKMRRHGLVPGPPGRA